MFIKSRCGVVEDQRVQFWTGRRLSSLDRESQTKGHQKTKEMWLVHYTFNIKSKGTMFTFLIDVSGASCINIGTVLRTSLADNQSHFSD